MGVHIFPISRIYAVIFAVLLVLISSASAGYRCQTINKGRMDFELQRLPVAPSVCAGVVNYPIAIQDGTCQDEMEGKLAFFGSLLTLFSEGKCRDSIARAVCTATYPKCSAIVSQEVPCRTLCDRIAVDCTSQNDLEALQFFKISGYYDFDCDVASKWSADTATCNNGPGLSPIQPFVASCFQHDSTACQGVVKEDAFLPPGYTPTALSRSADQLQYIYSLSSITYGCDVAQATQVCGNILRHCEMLNVYGDRYIPVPRLSCHSVCDNYLESCQSFFQDFSQIAGPLIPDCEAKNYMQYPGCTTGAPPSRPGIDFFPRTSSKLFSFTAAEDFKHFQQNESYDFSTSCVNFSAPESPTYPGSGVKGLNVICPYPLVVPEDTGRNEFVVRVFDSHCSPGCPMGMWTLDEYQIFDNVAIAGMLISLILSVFLSITWFCFSIRRQNKYVTYMTYVISTMYIFIFAMYVKNWIQGHPSGAHALCRTNYIEYQMGDSAGAETSYCVFNAIMVVYCVSSIVAWWLVQTIAVFLKVVLELKTIPGSSQDTAQNVIFHFIGFGLPALSVIGTLVAGAVGGYSSGLSWCFFSQGRYDQGTSVDYSLALFFIPIMVYTGLGTFCMAGVMLKLAWISRRGSHNENKTMWQRCMCNVYIRIILFILTMCALWITVIVYKSESMALSDKWEEGLNAYYLCTLVTQYLTPIECGAHPSVRMPYHLQFLITFCITWAGGIITATNATTSDIYVEWARFFIRVFPCCKRLKCCVSISQYRGTSDVTDQSDDTANRSFTNTSGEKNVDKSNSSASRRPTIQTNKYFYSPRHTGRKSLGPGQGIDLRTAAQLSYNSSSADARHSGAEVELTSPRRDKSQRGTTVGSVNLRSIVESIEKSQTHSVPDDDDDRDNEVEDDPADRRQVLDRKRKKRPNKNSQFRSHFGSHYGSHFEAHMIGFDYDDDDDDDDDDEEEEAVTNFNVFMPDDEDDDGRVSRVLFPPTTADDTQDSVADKKTEHVPVATPAPVQAKVQSEEVILPVSIAEEDEENRASIKQLDNTDVPSEPVTTKAEDPVEEKTDPVDVPSTEAESTPLAESEPKADAAPEAQETQETQETQAPKSASKAQPPKGAPPPNAKKHKDFKKEKSEE